jgi:nitrous oxide reductase
MPRHDTQREPAEHLSRRSLLQGAATAGAAGLAVTALGGALSPAAAAAATRTPARAAAQAEGGTSAPAGPIVVHVRNAGTGDIEVFSGTSQTRLRDKDLAARIARAIG